MAHLTSQSRLSRTVWIAAALLWAGMLVWALGYFHPDEHFQLLEFANWYAARTPSADMPWEFHAQMRPSLQVWAVIALRNTMLALGWDQPFHLTFLLRLLSAAALLWAGWRVLRHIERDTLRWRMAILGLTLWFVPLLSVRFSSESWATLFFLFFWGKWLDVGQKNRWSDWFLAGTMLGMAFNMRYQMAFMGLGFVAWLCYAQKGHWKGWVAGVAGGVLSIGLGVLADSYFYGQPVAAPWQYFTQNILHDKASAYGREPWWWYLPEFLLRSVPPIGIALLLLFANGVRHQWITRNTASSLFHRDAFLLCMAATFLAGHCVVAHKELRFLFPLWPVLVYYAAIGWAQLQLPRWLQRTFWAINGGAAVVMLALQPFSSTHLLKWLWHYPLPASARVYATPANPYHWVGLRTYFYAPAWRDSCVVVPQFDHSAPLKKGDLLLQTSPVTPILAPGLTCRRVFVQYPEWILPFNYNDWQSRTPFWCGFVVE
jgi:GPI mannosyltransferase 3